MFLGKKFMLSSIKFKILRFRLLVTKEYEAVDNGNWSFKTLGTCIGKMTEKKVL